ncbi:hypothetical protein A9Q81_26410 [Gammaproteobacteria bacterium 42_54_T18]|nr:hypothetical protein A9Q81_26410 [Gammaproteobacteria bacterium 42_54_T18]
MNTPIPLFNHVRNILFLIRGALNKSPVVPRHKNFTFMTLDIQYRDVALEVNDFLRAQVRIDQSLNSTSHQIDKYKKQATRIKYPSRIPA